MYLMLLLGFESIIIDLIDVGVIQAVVLSSTSSLPPAFDKFLALSLIKIALLHL